MRIYADTSWWLAYKCSWDIHHSTAITLFDIEQDTAVVWTPWQRVEVFNAYLQAERVGLVGAGESRQMIRQMEREIRLGYWPHIEFNWTDAVQAAVDLALQHSPHRLVRGMDLFHVAIALEVGADGFLSFDDDQNALAGDAGLSLIQL